MTNIVPAHKAKIVFTENTLKLYTKRGCSWDFTSKLICTEYIILREVTRNKYAMVTIKCSHLPAVTTWIIWDHNCFPCNYKIYICGKPEVTNENVPCMWFPQYLDTWIGRNKTKQEPHSRFDWEKKSKRSYLYIREMTNKNIEMKKLFTFSYCLTSTLSKQKWIYPRNAKTRGKLWKTLVKKPHIL